MMTKHIAVWVAAVVHWALGAAWFTTFATPWMAGLRMSADQIKAAQAHPSPMPYVIALVCNLAMAYVLAWLLIRTGEQTAARGVKLGFALGVCIAAAAMITELSFEMRMPVFIGISAGYPVVGMMIMGAIVGGWKRQGAALTKAARA